MFCGLDYFLFYFFTFRRFFCITGFFVFRFFCCQAGRDGTGRVGRVGLVGLVGGLVRSISIVFGCLMLAGFFWFLFLGRDQFRGRGGAAAGGGAGTCVGTGVGFVLCYYLLLREGALFTFLLCFAMRCFFLGWVVGRWRLVVNCE